MLNRRELIKFGVASVACQCTQTMRILAQETNDFEICTEMLPDDGDKSRVIDLAIDEWEGNDPGRSGIETALLISNRWHPRRRLLNIDFINPPNYVDDVIASARKWEEHMLLSFRFGRGEPDILISFDATGGHWSYLGTASRRFASYGRPSMNFGWRVRPMKLPDLDRVVLHEFGHALSLIHEHMHPAADIPWNRAAVYSYYAELGWSQERVDQQIFAKYALSQLNSTEYDPNSVMHYATPAFLLNDASFATGWNVELSDFDKRLAAELFEI